MAQTLVVNHGEYEFRRFSQAVSELQEDFGYEGLEWEMVVGSGDLDILADFLEMDGLDVDLIDE